ncbi:MULTISPECIES: hypothetical protein [unclassified Desulfovibrio]|nr:MULTISPECIES: hypothetical protein [unclassified Desulfovibrio]
MSALTKADIVEHLYEQTNKTRDDVIPPKMAAFESRISHAHGAGDFT